MDSYSETGRKPRFIRKLPVKRVSSLLAAVVMLSLAALGAGTDSAPDTNFNYAQIRLYNYRHASQLASQLKDLFPALALSSAAPAPGSPADVADDVLIATPKDNPPNAAVPQSIGELKRLVALLDLPRPQVTLQVWSIKVSSKDSAEIEESVNRLHLEIEERNQRIQKALKFGWFKLMAAAQQDRTFLNPEFRDYISDAFVIDDTHPPRNYSLGYVHAFSPDQPSIATMLLCLAASDNPQMWINQVVDEMEAPNDAKAPKFTNFRNYLLALVDPGGTPLNPGGRLAALRAALADFLFQYKWATLYPHDFVAYDLQNSATVLDSLFAPAVDALNSDVEMYEKKILDNEKDILTQRGAKTQLSSRGLITVAALSGQQANVQGKTVSYFDITKPPSLTEMVNGITTAKGNLTALFPQVTGNPALVAAALAAISAQEKTFVQIEKGMNLVITPTTLATAASAELDINLDGGDANGTAAADAAPSFTGEKKDPTYAVDRIARHSVKTRVRVDSLKLFEVSTFSFDLMHPRPDGVVPVIGTVWQGVFGAVPGVGRLFTWRRAPEISANRSVIIVSALIVPTSMDLALGIRVESDRKMVAGAAGVEAQTRALHSIDEDPLLRKARPFHKKKLECLLAPSRWVTFRTADCGCGNLSLACVTADLR